MRKSVLIWVTAGAVAAILVVAGFFLGRSPKVPAALRPFPEPPRGTTYLLCHGRGGRFPSAPAEAAFRGRLAAGEAPDPLAVLMPLFASADEAALYVPLEGGGTGPIAAVRARRGDRETLESGRLPESLPLPDPRVRAEEGVLRVESAALPGALFLCSVPDWILIAQSASDLIPMREALEEIRPRLLPRGFREEPSWEAHVRACLGDGPLFGRFLRGERTRGDRPEIPSLILEAAIREDGEGGGEARFRIDGLAERFGPDLLRSWRPGEFPRQGVVPKPFLAFLGVNLPSDPDFLDALFPGAGEALVSLAGKEAAKDLAGPALLYVGGRTRILWFSLPGILLDLPDRGDRGKDLVRTVWERLFMGASPEPIEGFDVGGATDLPFSAVAVARDDRALLGLADPEALGPASEDEQVVPEEKCLLFLAADFARTSEALKEMGQLDEFLRDEPKAGAEEGLDAARRMIAGLGRASLILLTPETGRMTWSAAGGAAKP